MLDEVVTQGGFGEAEKAAVAAAIDIQELTELALTLGNIPAPAGKEGKADFREVTLGQTVDGQRVVLSGLAKGERVIVDGTQHVMPGALIQAQEVSGKVAAK